ncbi:MAG: hypothetical protein AAGB31_04505, partial [Bdellovibrio sp.]
QLTFHTTSASNPARYFESPTGSSMNMNVYVYDLKKKSLRKLTQNQVQDNSYYPVFRPDGTIVYSQINRGERPTFVHADPRQVRAVRYDPAEISSQEQKLNAIGQLWSMKCLGETSSKATSVTTALSLNNEKCKALVKEHWDELKTHVAGVVDSMVCIYIKMLQAACPQGAGSSHAREEVRSRAAQNVPESEISELNSGPEVLAAKCSLCHSDFSMTNIAKGKLSKEKAQKILERIEAPPPMRMPQMGTLSTREKALLTSYIQGL